MRADFLDAHQRHWNDAERLAQIQRWANADHLYGLAAECGLKQLMLIFGMRYDATKDRPSENVDRKHADEIWMRFETYRSGYISGASYTLPPSNPFQDWNASQRYAHQLNFDEARVNTHKTGTVLICNFIKKAQLEGLL